MDMVAGNTPPPCNIFLMTRPQFPVPVSLDGHTALYIMQCVRPKIFISQKANKHRQLTQKVQICSRVAMHASSRKNVS